MTVTPGNADGWVLLLTTLPGQNAAVRVGVWRALKAAGAASLRDGAYLLPDRPAAAAAFAGIEHNVVGSGGSAHLFQIAASDERGAALRALFDRGEQYAELADAAHALLAAVAGRPEAETRRAARQLRRDAAVLETIDYFPNGGRDRLQGLLRELDARIDRTFAPDEPSAIHASVEPRDRTEFQGRTWVTRRRLWVDRVASAWLIRRFIDDRASFLWLDNPEKRAAGTIGFDFDGAEFTHMSDLTTFEVLIVAFGLGEDLALAKLGALVHFLDLGGAPAPEAAGFEAILSGTREHSTDDHELLVRMSPVLDALYASFGTAKTPVPN